MPHSSGRWRCRLRRCVRRLRVADGREPGARAQTHAAGRGLRPARPHLPRAWHQGERQLHCGLRRRPERHLRGHGAVDRGPPARLRHVSHPDAIPGHAAIPATGGRGAAAAPQLGSVRHRARRLSAETPDARRARVGLRLAVPAAVLARVNLEASARARCPSGRCTSAGRTSTSARTGCGVS